MVSAQILWACKIRRAAYFIATMAALPAMAAASGPLQCL